KKLVTEDWLKYFVSLMSIKKEVKREYESFTDYTNIVLSENMNCENNEIIRKK
ncbi:9578_t:CDS:1, partial [Dentiscutata erythropus]